MDILIFSYFLTLSLIVFYLVFIKFEQTSKAKERINAHVKLRAPKEEILDKQQVNIKGQVMSMFYATTARLRNYYKTAAPSNNEDLTQLKLLRAGNPFNMTVADYYITNNIIRVATPLIFGAFAILTKVNISQLILSILIGFLLSFKALDIYIDLKTRQRYRKALRELPDFLDILTISVEAGLGFDLALSKTIEKRNGILPKEFHTCLEEMRLGKTRKDALLGIKERLNFDEIAAFVNSIIQSEKMGTGIVKTLRDRSEDERDKRKQRAEEQAMKMTIKILIPLVIFIFPSIFIMALGPALLQLATQGIF
ncbi:MAG: type II secretion system F family protein [Clostridiaceae bacterium]